MGERSKQVLCEGTRPTWSPDFITILRHYIAQNENQ